MFVRSGGVPSEGTERENQECGLMWLVNREEPVEGNRSQTLSRGFPFCNFSPANKATQTENVIEFFYYLLILINLF